MHKITVVIADDHPIVLFGVRELIKSDPRFEVVGEAGSSTELINVLHDKQPQILITDYNMPESSQYGDGLRLITYLTRNFPALRVLVLTMVSNSLILTRLYNLGVAGVIDKRTVNEELLRALEALSQNRIYKLAPANRNSVIDNGYQIDERMASLSTREVEILRLFVSGMSLRDIAINQNRSPKTISTQKIAAMRKLDVRSDQELVSYCLEANLFQ
ncbi:response regulator [Pseudomonas palmensis]|uniref:response regulator n=1 Tax=Pseudomonas palmensis TaxID=2815362 RepID=UPI001AE95BE6|nr:response regulator [Pseudomonas palmensis]